jgi:Fe-S cluster assembly protein SufD
MSANPKHVLPASLERLKAAFATRPATTPEVQSIQAAALERFLARGFPTQRDEAWRYTDLRRLEMRSFQPLIAAGLNDVAALPDFQAARLVFVDGRFSAGLSESSCEGLRVRTWSRAASADTQLTREIFAETDGFEGTAFRDLNTAFLETALLLELAPNVSCAKPVHVVHVWTDGKAPQMSHPRLIVRVGLGSRMTLIEQYVAAGDFEHFTNAQTLVSLAENAQLVHCRLQEESLRTFHIGAVQAQQARDSRYHFAELALGGTLGRTDLHIRLTAPGAHAEVDGLFFPRATQHLDVHTRIDHLAPHTTSDENYRGIAHERGRGIFAGKAVVHPGAQKIEAHQSSRNLLLSPQAEIDSKPNLEIYANDVKCSHGSTTGRLDPAALFYLRSRGIGEQQARILLIHAFAESVLSAVPGESLRAYLQQRLADKLNLPLGEAA